MASKDEWIALAKRCEEAPEQDDDLNGDVFQAVGGPEWDAAYRKAQEPCGCPHDQAVEYARRYADDFTGSLEEAIALTEREFADRIWRVTRRSSGHYIALIAPDGGYGGVEADANTPALALMAVFCKVKGKME